MPICPNGHGPQSGRFCPECGSRAIDDPPAPPSGDSVRVRSPEAHANVNQTFVLPGGAVPGAGVPPALVKCPKCGRRNEEPDTFDCQGPCGREGLCLRHFDEEQDVCRDCAAARRQAAEAARRMAEEAAKPIWQRIGIELIRIPAGEFLYGVFKEKITLPEYYIAKTPVTNAQYKAFVDATVHDEPYAWFDEQFPEGKANHPVEVSWDDANAFCAWAGVRLPTEQEWEKAARGTDGREYPWGAWQLGRCNSREANIGTTSPVDRFPSGASPYGLLDVAGNVWEWCADWYDSKKQARVLRGGSFSDGAQLVRCAVRYRNFPELRGGDDGFRVASPGL